LAAVHSFAKTGGDTVIRSVVVALVGIGWFLHADLVVVPANVRTAAGRTVVARGGLDRG
jgi:hypothetical protein